MKKQIALGLWILFVGVLLGTFAHAGDVTIQGGLQQTPNSNYGNGSEWVARYEQPIYKDFGLGIEGAYHGKTSHNYETGSYGDVSGYSVLLDILYHPSVSWKLKPYILGGVGWSWWSFDRSQEMIDKGIEINLGDCLAYKVGAGLDYPLGKGWYLNVEWNHFQCDILKDSHYQDGSFANVLGDDNRSGSVRIGQGEENFLIGLKKRF